MRQLTTKEPHDYVKQISKLPMRQLTEWGIIQDFAKLF